MTKMAKNNDLIRKYKLEEAVKRIQKINEYTFYNTSMVEDDEQNQDAQNGGQMDGMQGNQQMPQMGGDPNAMGDMNQAGGEQPMGDPNQMGGMQDAGQMPMDDMGGGDPNAMGNDMPMDDMGGSDMGGTEDFGDDFEDVEMDTEQPGDEVVDVDELTQSQETTEFKVDNVDDKLNKVLKIISKFNDAIDANDKKIDDLKKEFEKRNPTPEETLNLRSLASYPFSERPDEYWKKQQEEHPNYNVISDNNVSTADEQKEFEIRKSDIDNFNERDIMNTLGESIKLSNFLEF